MNPEWIEMLREMRNQGYAVILWTPEELGDVDPEWVEDASISYGNEYLIEYEDAPKKEQSFTEKESSEG